MKSIGLKLLATAIGVGCLVTAPITIGYAIYLIWTDNWESEPLLPPHMDGELMSKTDDQDT